MCACVFVLVPFAVEYNFTAGIHRMDGDSVANC